MGDATNAFSGLIQNHNEESLRIQVPSEKVFGVGLEGPRPFEEVLGSLGSVYN